MTSNTDPASASSPVPPSRRTGVVGIGASAGGLEALEEFLAAVPPASGLSFVVVQHLDPDREDVLGEILARATDMPVTQITDRTVIEPDHVYVIPPGHDLSILGGRLHLMEQVERHGLRLPIDTFFRSLAVDQRERGVGVILSGTGSDGTLGLRAIKERAGAAFVQSPESAKFDGMPRSAIDSGLADVVAPAGDLPPEIVAFLTHVSPATPNGRAPTEADLGELEKIFILLRERTGHDFSGYKHQTIRRRVERRMGLHQLAYLPDYVRYLRGNPDELDLLFKELLIGVTSFFRDPEVWDDLRDTVLPSIIARYASGGVVRAWVPGCSTGEEAYSLAIVFREAVERAELGRACSIQVFATDIDQDAIDVARAGIYQRNIVADVSEARLNRRFVDVPQGYQVATEIREAVVFARQDVIMDPPFTKLDLVSCRNLLIYLAMSRQQDLIRIFHYALNPLGTLVLGSAETCDIVPGLFERDAATPCVYRRLDAIEGFPAMGLPLGPALHEQGRPADLMGSAAPSLHSLVTDLIVREHSPAAVLTNAEGDVLYTTARTGMFLEPPVGKANLNIFNMARDGLREHLDVTFHRATAANAPATARGARFRSGDDEVVVDIEVDPLPGPGPLAGKMLVVFTRRAQPLGAEGEGEAGVGGGEGERDDGQLDALRAERELLRTTRQHMQVVQEQLRSTNEELQSTNEELQSTNEELSTSKEEMQSMNEELRTVNRELQSKMLEAAEASDDMKNLLNATEIAILFLDVELRVRRFTQSAARYFRLRAGDVGRPITDVVTDLALPSLAQDARSVMETLAPRELEVASDDDRWVSVRMLPYLAQGSRIDGVVMTFVDVTAAKLVERELAALKASGSSGQGLP